MVLFIGRAVFAVCFFVLLIVYFLGLEREGGGTGLCEG